MNLVEAIQQKDTVTENGMVTNSTSLNANLDLFFKIGASRKAEENVIIEMFSSAFNESPIDAMRILFWGRDARGGAGERRFFRICLKHLVKDHDHILLKNLHLVTEYGRWDDLLSLIGTPMEELVIGLIHDDLTSGGQLSAKWMPRKGPVANILRKGLGLTPREYRKLLVQRTEVVEQKMCSNEWTSINYSTVPSLAAARYQKSFMKNDNLRYSEYLKALKDPNSDIEVKINAGAIYPYDVIKSLNSGIPEVANEQWKALPNYLEGSNEMILPVVDVSGSMFSNVSENGSLTCIDVAISLGLYISERNNGPFKDHFMTFEESPKLQKLHGSLIERCIQLGSSDWGGNTDIEAVFNLVLKQATINKISEKDMPTKILIVSDMEFDDAVIDGESVSVMSMIKDKYERCGYDLPSVIFWNVQSRKKNNVPVRFDENGTALISGFSPSILKSILGGKKISPISIMNDTVNSERYKNITV